VISKDTAKHQKHTKLVRPETGTFGRNEIAILGTNCQDIRTLAYSIVRQLSSLKVAYVDADHKVADQPDTNSNSALANGSSLEYTDKISYQRFDFKKELTSFQKRGVFNDQDLILVNGNHFSANYQVVVVDPAKDLQKKIDRLTNVRLILLTDKGSVVPDYLRQLPYFDSIPVFRFDDSNRILDFVRTFVAERVPPLNGLVLSGGASSRMKKDKGSLVYRGITQREYLFGMLSNFCKNSFISCNAIQAAEIHDFPIIQDAFLHLGPLGGILSALQSDPNSAWLTLACDLPYLTEKTVHFLVQNRNPSKIATAFLDPKGEFPEPLITIWEPKSYSVLLQFLGQGYSCPRKVLINSEIELLTAPDEKEFLNANFPDEYENALRDLNINWE
jgi:molybdopterin-guanine dinucleotide biosynthesis protein A